MHPAHEACYDRGIIPTTGVNPVGVPFYALFSLSGRMFLTDGAEGVLNHCTTQEHQLLYRWNFNHGGLLHHRKAMRYRYVVHRAARSLFVKNLFWGEVFIESFSLKRGGSLKNKNGGDTPTYRLMRSFMLRFNLKRCPATYATPHHGDKQTSRVVQQYVVRLLYPGSTRKHFTNQKSTLWIGQTVDQT